MRQPPRSTRTATLLPPTTLCLSIVLHSSFPTAIYWGPELRLLYNDAWAPVPAERHPKALGRPAREVWADIWDVIGPQFEKVIAEGEGFSRSEERRVGKECVSTCRSRWSPYH